MQKSVLLALLGSASSKHLVSRNKMQSVQDSLYSFNGWISDDQSSVHFEGEGYWSFPSSNEQENIQYEAQCDIKEEDIMEVSEFMRVTYYTIWNNMVKGFYGLDDKHPIDQQCMGDWMQDDIDYLMDIYTEEAYYGLTTVSYERSLEAAMKSVDLVYNSDYQCQYETIMFDIIYTAFDQYDYNVAEFIT